MSIRVVKIILSVATALLLSLAPALAQEIELPKRETPRPKTTLRVPHIQLEVKANVPLAQELLRRVAKFPGVTLGPTRVSLPGAIGFQLNPDMPLARPNSIVGGLEFAHLHQDGSLHASLNPKVAVAAIEAGWAIAHPWADQRYGWKGFVMLYTPTTEAELEVVTLLVKHSYAYVTGQTLAN